MPVYSDNLSPTTCSNPATSLSQTNLVSQKAKENWTEDPEFDAENMVFEEMFNYQNAETNAEPGSLDSIDLRLLNEQAVSAANQQGSLLESIPPLQNFNQPPNNFYTQNNSYEKFTNQPFSCANAAVSNGMMVSSHAFQNLPQVGAPAQHFDSAEMSYCGTNLNGDDMTGIVRSDQLRTHTMTVTKSNHGGVMSNLPEQFDSSNGNSSSALTPLNSNQLAELKVVKNGDAPKSQEKEDEKGYRNDPTSQKKDKYGFATRRILENQDDEIFPQFPDRPNAARFINENVGFPSSTPENHRQSRIESRKRNYERECAAREEEIGPNDRQVKMEERLRMAKEATQRSAMIEKARDEQMAEKEARLKKIREIQENEKKQREQLLREQQQRREELERRKLEEQRLKARQTIVGEPEEFILEEVNPQALLGQPFGTLASMEDMHIIEGGFEEIDESRFVFLPEQQIQNFAGPAHVQPQSIGYDLTTSEIQEVPVHSNKDTQNGATVIEEDEGEPAWKNEGLIKTKIMQEAFAWTAKANKHSMRKNIPRQKLKDERYTTQTDFAFMAFLRHVITQAMKSFSNPRMSSNNMLLWDLARDLKSSDDNKHEQFKENMKSMSKILTMNNGKHQNAIFTDLVMFMQEKFKNGGKLEREAFLDEMTVQQKEEAKKCRARKIAAIKAGKVKKRVPKKLGRPRKNPPKTSTAPEDPTASQNPQITPATVSNTAVTLQ